jgi:hypothetical protein
MSYMIKLLLVLSPMICCAMQHDGAPSPAPAASAGPETQSCCICNGLVTDVRALGERQYCESCLIACASHEAEQDQARVEAEAEQARVEAAQARADAPAGGSAAGPTVPEAVPFGSPFLGHNASEPHPPNQLLVITGLQNAPQHNGRRCWVLQWMPARQRYNVVMRPDETLNVRAQNVRLPVGADFQEVPANVFANVDDDDAPNEPNQYRVVSYPDMGMFHLILYIRLKNCKQ